MDADLETRDLLKNIDLQFKTFLTEIIGDERQTDENVNWDVSLYALNGCYSTEEYSGIFIASVLYFLVLECPYFHSFESIKNFQIKIFFMAYRAIFLMEPYQCKWVRIMLFVAHEFI